MAVAFVFLAVAGFFVILWNLLIICIGVLMLVLGFGIPSIGNNTPIGITHYAITTDYYNEGEGRLSLAKDYIADAGYEWTDEHELFVFEAGEES